MAKIRMAIIGMGRMGITHYSIINTHPDVEIVAVSDTSSTTLSIMEKYIKGIKTYTDYVKLIDESKLDAIIVCTPPNLHYPIVKCAYKNNLHVFVEKPFTANRKEAEELTILFSQSSLVNLVGYVNRYNDIFKKVNELVKGGLLGEVIRFRSEMFSCTVTKSDEESGWRAKRENGGGATFEVASHAIDLINFLVGAPDKVAGTSMNQVHSKYVEDIVSSTFLYKDGKVGSLYVNWSDESFRKPTNKIEIFGSKGKILADQHSCKIYLNKETKDSNFRKGWNTLYITDVFKPVEFYVRGNEFTRQLYDFADLIAKKKVENRCSFKDALQTQIIIDEMFKNSGEFKF
jgi:predicted dehydrogenase